MTIRTRLSRKDGWGWIDLGNWNRARRDLVGVCLAAVLLASFVAIPTSSGVFPRDELIANARQLCTIIEDNHADPYYHGGGWVKSLDEEAD